MKPAPSSCDTFVYVAENKVFFGKNSDRPHAENQNVVFFPKQTHLEKQVKCTYISVAQVPETYAVLLCQPYWLWGAEMGANEFGVVIGNEAVDTKEPLADTGLLGMDLVRLGLERGKTAFEAVDVIIHHIEKYGQGGPCRCSIMHKFAYFLSTVGDWSYHNSFLVADPKEAYVLETAGAWWVAERVTCGPRNISNGVSITTSYFKAREGIVEHAKAKGYLKTDEYGGSRHGLIPVSSGKMNFRDSFSTSCVQISEDEWKADSREETVRCMLDDARKMSENKDVIKLMKSVLSEHNTGVCMHGEYVSTCAMISLLQPEANKTVHWITGTPFSCSSLYKPFQFNAVSPQDMDNTKPDSLWHLHKKISTEGKLEELEAKLRELEEKGLYVGLRLATGQPSEENSWAEMIQRERDLLLTL